MFINISLYIVCLWLVRCAPGPVALLLVRYVRVSLWPLGCPCEGSQVLLGVIKLKLWVLKHHNSIQVHTHDHACNTALVKVQQTALSAEYTRNITPRTAITRQRRAVTPPSQVASVG